jgi:hypothetical protein
MGNVIYDILPDSVINPFIGAGIGANHVSVDVTGQFSNVPGADSRAEPGDPEPDDRRRRHAPSPGSSSPAWPGGPPTAARRPDLPLPGGSDVDMTSVGTGTLQPGVFSGEYKDESVTLGLRYIFLPPPAAAASAAAAAAASAASPAAAAAAASAGRLRGQAVHRLLPVRSVRDHAGSPGGDQRRGELRQERQRHPRGGRGPHRHLRFAGLQRPPVGTPGQGRG